MVDPNWDRRELTTFRGSQSLLEVTDVPSDGALLSVNTEFQPGAVKTRYSFRSVFDPSDAITGMWNWVFSDPNSLPRNFLVWWKTGYGVRLTDLNSISATNIWNESTAYAGVFAPAGSRFYGTQFDTTGKGVGHARVYGHSVGVDTLFGRPMLTTEVTLAASASSGGSATPGTHRVAFVMTTRNGFVGPPGPVTTGMVLSPTTVTTTSTNKTIGITVTPASTWPAYAGTIQIVMTTASDQNTYYFVPGAILSTPAGGGLAVTYSFTISDDDLAATGIDATKYRFFLTQDSSNNPPFSPSAIFEAGNRMAYVVKGGSGFGPGVFFSEPNNFQAIAADRNLFPLPGQREVTIGFRLRETNYILGPRWTYSCSDNGDFPSTWASAQLVDGDIGTPSPRGVCISPSQGSAWVAAVSGLYRFAGGQYSTRPISYFNQPDWDRINWAAFYAVEVKDNTRKKTVMVKAPLKAVGRVSTSGTTVAFNSGDEFTRAWTSGTTITINGSNYTISSVTSSSLLTITSDAGTQTDVVYSVTPTYPTHILAWAYYRGVEADDVDFSLWSLAAGFNPGGLEVVQNDTTKRLETWVANFAAGKVLRQTDVFDTNNYTDDPGAIDCRWRSALLPGANNGGSTPVFLHHGAEFRVLGSGTLDISSLGLDGAQGAGLSSITLSNASGSPGRQYFRGMRLISESKSYTLSNLAASDAWFMLSRLIDYYSEYARQR